MILELADIRIQPGQQAAFDEAIQRAISTVISKAKGFQGFKVNKGIESPERYILQIFWETLENHTVDFRGSPNGARSSVPSSRHRPWSSISICWPSRIEAPRTA
jgi:heme-degrading monooxygenase HmoA